MFKKNTAVPGYPLGVFISVTTGEEVTTGTPTCTRLLDGTGGACANAAAYDATSGIWKIDLAASDLNADIVGLKADLSGCIPIHHTIKTVAKLVSDLIDAAAAPSATTVASQVRTELGTELGRIDVAISSRNATTPPTEAEIAAEVLSELAASIAKVNALYARFYNKVTKDASNITVYDTDGTTPLTVQAYTEGTTDTVNAPTVD